MAAIIASIIKATQAPASAGAEPKPDQGDTVTRAELVRLFADDLAR